MTVFVFVNLFLGGILSGGALLVNVMACLHALWHHQGLSLHLFMHCFAGFDWHLWSDIAGVYVGEVT